MRDFFLNQLIWKGSQNYIKILWCRFEKCLGTCAMLVVEASSETRLFRHLSNHVFGVRNFRNIKAMRVMFFFKRFRISAWLQKSRKRLRKTFFFTDNCIWIGIVKLSLLRTGYLSSESNVLTSSPKIWHVNKGDFFQLYCPGSYQRIC